MNEQTKSKFARLTALLGEEEAEARNVHSLNIIILGQIGGAVAGAILFVILWLLDPAAQAILRMAIIPGAVVVGSLPAYWLLRRGHTNAAGYVVSLGLVIVALLTLHLFGGITGAGAVVYAWAIIASWFVPKGRPGFVVLAVSILTYFSLAVVEQTGLLPAADVDEVTLTFGTPVLVTIMLSLVCLGVWLLSDNLKKALQEVRQQAVKLDAQLEENKLQSAELQAQFDKNERLVRQIRDTAEQLAPMAEELAATMEQMNAAAEQIAATTSQMSQGAESQAHRTEEAAHSAAQLASATGQIAANAHQAGNASTRSQEFVQNTAQEVKALEAKLGEIEQMVTLVEKIADQTNLLALNASIEAARAGEHGAGFAVVADEVRRLAEHSANSVREIIALSREIGSRLEEVLAAMEETQKGAAHTVALAQEVVAATEEQERATEVVVGAMNEVASVAEESAAASEEIAASVEEQVASMEQVASSVQALAELTASLQQTLEGQEGK